MLKITGLGIGLGLALAGLAATEASAQRRGVTDAVRPEQVKRKECCDQAAGMFDPSVGQGVCRRLSRQMQPQHDACLQKL